MKIRKKNDITILLFSLLLFSLGVGWIYSKSTPQQTNNDSSETIPEVKPTEKEAEIMVPEPPKAPEPPAEIPSEDDSYDNKTSSTEPPPIKAQELMTPEEMLEYLDEWELSQGIEPIVVFFNEYCPKDRTLEILSKVLEKNKDNFNREEKLNLIVSIGEHYKNDKAFQQKIFDFIDVYKDIEEGEIPLLFLLVDIGKKEAITDIVEWYRARQKPNREMLKKETLEYAAKNDYAQALKKLHENGAEISKELATELLWDVIRGNKGSKSIEFLKSLGADLDAYDREKKVTILIQAIKNKNFDAVKELVKLGADVAKPSKDKEIGYPLQVARELGQVDIDLYLRSKGAKD